jgi:hypothetical protein
MRFMFKKYVILTIRQDRTLEAPSKYLKKKPKNGIHALQASSENIIMVRYHNESPYDDYKHKYKSVCLECA